MQALSDAEREEIAQQDPAVREMIERAAAATPEDLMRLHGRVTMRDPRAGETRGDGRRRHLPARHPRACCGPIPTRDPYDRMLDGRTATVERIYLDYDDRVHLAVSIDDDPGARPDARERPLPLLQARGGRADMSEPRARQILVAGVGNAFLRDDGFGGEVAPAAGESATLPEGVRCSTSAPAASTWPTR